MRWVGRGRWVSSAAAGAAVALLVGCSGSPASDSTSAFVDFGPFGFASERVTESGVNGPGDIRLPDGTLARVNAAELLGTGPEAPPLVDRDNYEVVSEQYSYTLDDGVPVLVGVVQATHTMHFRGYTEDETATFVLAISAEPKPQELARTRILRGGEHTAEIAGRSDHGVIAVLLDGELNSNVPNDSRVVGVDAVRATEVWGKDHGYPVYGDTTAEFYRAASPESCASEVQRYNVANGIPERVDEIPNTDVDSGGTCRTASDKSGDASAAHSAP